MYLNNYYSNYDTIKDSIILTDLCILKKINFEYIKDQVHCLRVH